VERISKRALIWVPLLLAGVLGYYLWTSHTATPSPLTPEEQGWLVAKGEIVVAGSLDPPFAYLDERGEYVGFTLDLLGALEMVLGVEFRFSPMGRRYAIPALDQGVVDAVLGEVPSPGSGQTYSLPYLSSSVALFASGDDFLEDDLEGEMVAVVTGGQAYELLSERGGVTLLQVADVEQGLKELQSGGARAFAGDENAGLYTLHRLGLEEIKIVGEPLERVNYSFAVREDDRTLLRALDYGLAALEELGLREQIQRRWLGLPVEKGSEAPMSPVTMVLAGVVLFLGSLVAFLWSRSLRREVAEKGRELSEAQDKYKKLLDSANDAILTISPADGSLLEVNHRVETLTGYSKDELLTTGLERLLSLKDRRRAMEGLQATLLTGSGYLHDLTFLRKDGSNMSVEMRANVVAYDGRRVIQCILQDVTERKEMRRELLERTEDLSAINAIAATVGRFVDLEEILSEVLTKVLELMKMEGGIIFLIREEDGRLAPVVQKGFWATEEAVEMARQVAERGETLMVSDLASDPQLVGMKARRGEWGSLASVPVKSKDKVQGVMNIYGRSIHRFDPGDRELIEAIGSQIGVAVENATLFQRLKRTVGELSAVKQFNESVLQNMSDGLLVADIEGRITLANRAASEILGHESLEGRSIGEVMGEEEIVVREGIERGVVVVRREVEVRKGDGGIVPLGMSVSPLRGEGGGIGGVVVVFSDMSEARRIEEERRRLDRLALLGEMSAMVAHEIRNPLAGIGAGVQHLAEKMGREDPRYESIEMIMRESERVNRIIEDILMISRPVGLHLAPCDMVKVTEEILDDLQEKAKTHGVEMVTYFASDLPSIRGDAFRLSRALSELVAHRIEVMPDGGELRVVVTSEGGQVEVEVRDSGLGIREEDRGKIFEPFWSRKPGGTGLGLAIAKRIIEEHGGEIRVESEEGKGSVFRVRIPMGG